MSKLSIIPIFILTAGIVMTGISLDAQKKGKAQTICPVMGDPINKKYYVDYKGYRIYFCCSSCPEDFKKNPGKYMKKLRESGVTLEKAPAGEKGGVSKKKNGDHSKHKHHGD